MGKQGLKQNLFDLAVLSFQDDTEENKEMFQYYKLNCLPILGLQEVTEIIVKAQLYVDNQCS